MSNKENAALTKEAILEEIDEEWNLDDFESTLDEELRAGLADAKFLKEEQEKIGSPENLGKVIGKVVWDQFINQIGVIAGEDFIKENRGLKLDLSDDAHIQTTENFAEGKIATHNTKIDYQQRYDDWQDNFQRDENGNVKTYIDRAGRQQPILEKEARKPFDAGRPTGSKEGHTDMDHTVPTAELIRDPAVNAHMSKEEQIDFANSDKNLHEMDAGMNRSKKENSMPVWLDCPNAKGQKPNEIFDLDAEKEKEFRKKDKEARAELEKRKKEGEKKSIEAGKASQREEAFRIGKAAVRAVVMGLLTELAREIISKLIKWLRSGKKTLAELMNHLKLSIQAFLGKMKQHVLTAGDTVVTTIATAIYGPIVSMLKKVWIMLKQAGKALKNAWDFFLAPENKRMPIGIRIAETGKIIIAGVTGAGALLLGEVIEKQLMVVPGFAVEIPLLGSLANLLGIFFGTVSAGIIGAIAINLIEKKIETRLKRENTDARFDANNKVLATQQIVKSVKEKQLIRTKESSACVIAKRHVQAAQEMRRMCENIRANGAEDVSIRDNLEAIRHMSDQLKSGAERSSDKSELEKVDQTLDELLT